MENIAEILGALGIGSIGSGLITYLGVRKKVGSGLEAEYMKLFQTAIQASADRIDSLEERLDTKEQQMMVVVREEREQCKKELLDLEKRLKNEWDRQITDGRKRLTSEERAALEADG